MNQATQDRNVIAEVVVLYMALELSAKIWRVAFGDGRRRRHVRIDAGDRLALLEAVAEAKRRFGLPADAPVYSCYEAGRDGFWLHRFLSSVGIANVVVDSASIEVNRRRRRAKTDRLDADKLLAMLVRYWGGERGVWSVLRVPSEEAEDARRLHRERDQLVKERGIHRNRITSLLIGQGIRLEVDRHFLERLSQVRCWDGRPLPPELRGELEREYARLIEVQAQLATVEKIRRQRLREPRTEAERQVVQLIQLGAIGENSAWLFVMEFFGWRAFRNRKQLGALAGLVGTPHQSGEMSRDLGISKAGNRRVRSTAVEIAWLWLRYQPDSELSQWYQRRFASGGKRMRRIGIVALARRLLIALWRYLEDGVIPAGAHLIPSRV